jgi:hypothetical protein
MSTIFQKYGAAVASFVVVLLTALSVLPANPSIVDILQLVVLVASAVGIFFVPLLKGSWAAGGKMAVELVGVLVIALIPFFVNGVPSREQIVVIIIALIKAGATQLGVIIRTDVPVTGGLVPDPDSLPRHAR